MQKMRANTGTAVVINTQIRINSLSLWERVGERG
jgi:hypothetical protein